MKSSITSQPTLTLQALSRRSVLVLFAAMAVALAAGLLAWGPVVLAPDVHRYADMRTLGSVPNFMNTLASVPMLLVGLWGWRAVRRSHWAPSVRRAWSWFFASAAASGSINCLYHLAPSNAGFVIAHAVGASGFALVLLGFLAERVDARFGSVGACIGAVVAASVAAGLCWFDAAGPGAGDLRALLLLEMLPLLLIPAGALDLRGRYTSAADWVLLLCLYAMARLCDLADEPILELTGWISGHALMHVGTAAVAAWIALRCSQATTRSVQRFGSFGDSSQRKTSLYTSF